MKCVHWKLYVCIFVFFAAVGGFFCLGVVHSQMIPPSGGILHEYPLISGSSYIAEVDDSWMRISEVYAELQRISSDAVSQLSARRASQLSPRFSASTMWNHYAPGSPAYTSLYGTMYNLQSWQSTYSIPQYRDSYQSLRSDMVFNTYEQFGPQKYEVPLQHDLIIGYAIPTWDWIFGPGPIATPEPPWPFLE